MLPKRGIMAIYSADDDDPVERGWPEFPSRCFQGSPPLSGPSTGKSLTGSFQCAGGRLIMESFDNHEGQSALSSVAESSPVLFSGLCAQNIPDDVRPKVRTASRDPLTETDGHPQHLVCIISSLLILRIAFSVTIHSDKV